MHNANVKLAYLANVTALSKAKKKSKYQKSTVQKA